MKLIEDKRTLKTQEKFEDLGGEIELCVFNIPKDSCLDYHLHLEASIEGMKIFKYRYEDSWKKRNGDLDINKYYNIKIFEDKTPKGAKISIPTFLGKGYDIKNRCIDLYEYSNDIRINKNDINGLAYALLDPPHGLYTTGPNEKWSTEYGKHEQLKLTELFHLFINDTFEINNLENTNHLEVYKWSNDWSNYFDAGKEWWGTFYWSIIDKKRDKIIIIAASATD